MASRSHFDQRALIVKCPKCGKEFIDNGDGFLRCDKESCLYCAHSRVRLDVLGTKIYRCVDCGLRWELVGKLWVPVGQAQAVKKPPARRRSK